MPVAAWLDWLAAAAVWTGALLGLGMLERLSRPPNAWDRRILISLQRLRTRRRDRFFSGITWAGSLYTLIPAALLAIIALAGQGRVGAGLWVAASLSGAAVISRLAKIRFDRPRPGLFPVDGDMPCDASYPSAHTAQAVSFALALGGSLVPNAEAAASALSSAGLALSAVAVAVSRIYLQVHYPSDVLGGFVLGALWTAGLVSIGDSLGFSAR